MHLNVYGPVWLGKKMIRMQQQQKIHLSWHLKTIESLTPEESSKQTHLSVAAGAGALIPRCCVHGCHWSLGICMRVCAALFTAREEYDSTTAMFWLFFPP